MAVRPSDCVMLAAGGVYDAKGAYRECLVGVTAKSAKWHRPQVVGVVDGVCFDMGRGFTAPHTKNAGDCTFSSMAGDGSRAPRSSVILDKLLSLRDSARVKWEHDKDKPSTPETTPDTKPEPTPKPEPVPAPFPSVPAPAKTGDSLTDAIVGIVSEHASGAIVDSILPRIESMVAEAIAARVPRRTEIKTGAHEVTFDEVVHAEFARVLFWLANKENVYLVGASGTGKTHMGRQLAKALGLGDERYYPTGKINDEGVLLGYNDAYGKYVEGLAYIWMKNGGLLLWDEFDRSNDNAVTAFNMILDNGYYTFPNGETVYKHTECYGMAAGNTLLRGADDAYSGAIKQDDSVAERFSFLTIDYDPRVEDSLAEGDAEILTFVRSLRAAAVTCGTDLVVSMRAIRRLVIAKHGDESLDGVNGAVNAAILKSRPSDDLRVLRSKMVGLENNRYYKAMGSLVAA